MMAMFSRVVLEFENERESLIPYFTKRYLYNLKTEKI